MVMLTNVRFPTSPFIEQATGRPAREWVLWLQAPQLLTLSLNVPLAASSGGTGQSSYTVGDLLYASGTAALSKLADVATGNALLSGGVGVAPFYGKVGLTTHITGTLAVGNGGSGATTLTGYLKGNGTSPFTAVATVPAADISGTLAVGNGGTGATTLTGYVIGNGTAAFTASSTIPNTAITGLGTMATENIGVSGSFTAQSGETITVTNGIITSIV